MNVFLYYSLEAKHFFFLLVGEIISSTFISTIQISYKHKYFEITTVLSVNYEIKCFIYSDLSKAIQSTIK